MFKIINASAKINGEQDFLNRDLSSFDPEFSEECAVFEGLLSDWKDGFRVSERLREWRGRGPCTDTHMCGERMQMTGELVKERRFFLLFYICS